MGETSSSQKVYTLMGPDRKLYKSELKGTYGGNKKSKVYGRMDCPAALRGLAKWGTAPERVFFADEQTAIAAGFRPCASCLRDKYNEWKALQEMGGHKK